MKNYLLLSLNDEKTKVNLNIDDGRTDEFIAQTENGELKIYSKEISVKQVSEDFWISYNGIHGAFIRDKYHPPFGECFVHIQGHSPSDYPNEIKEYLRILFHHMKFWSMVYTIEHFMEMIKSYQDFMFENIKPQLGIGDVFGGLVLRKERKHNQLESVRNIRRLFGDFMYYGLNSDLRGLEKDVSEGYLPKFIAGRYLSFFDANEIEFTKRVIVNATEENVKKMNDEFLQTWLDYQKRIENLINATKDFERIYYQEYQLRLVERTQEFTLLSIIILIIVNVYNIFKNP